MTGSKFDNSDSARFQLTGTTQSPVPTHGYYSNRLRAEFPRAVAGCDMSWASWLGVDCCQGFRVEAMEACAKSRFDMEACGDPRRDSDGGRQDGEPSWAARSVAFSGTAATPRVFTDETFIALVQGREGPQPDTAGMSKSVPFERVNPQTRAMRRWSERERKPSVATDMERVNLRLQVQDLQQQLEQKEQKMQAMTRRAKIAPATSSKPAPDIVPVMTEEGNATARRSASPERVKHHHGGHHNLHGGHHHHRADTQLPVAHWSLWKDLS